MLLLAPTEELVASLPGGRLPDRNDFHRYQPEERMRIWRGICDSGRQLAGEFAELMATNRWAERVRPYFP